MAQDIITAATELPAIIQSFIGSALFGATLWGGQRLYSYAARNVAGLSQQRRRNYLITQIAKLRISTTTDNAEGGIYLSFLIYRSLRSLFRALIWLVLGLLWNAASPAVGLVGYLGAIYFLFEGLNTVRQVEVVDDKPAKLKEYESELERIDSNAEKSPAPAS